MVVPTRSLAEITQAAIRLLVREMGPADTLRFVNQFSSGHGNYTEERDALFADMTLDGIVAEIDRQRGAREGEQTTSG